MPAAIRKEELPFWGADRELKNRPAGKKEANSESVTGYAGDDYDRIPAQVPRVEILVSTEHRKMPPIFGTSCPPKGVSGILRRFAFRFSEGQKAHWLLLLAADRVDVIESSVVSLLRGRPDNPFSESGIVSELRRGGFPRRFGHDRADTKRLGKQALLTGLVFATLYLWLRDRRWTKVIFKPKE